MFDAEAVTMPLGIQPIISPQYLSVGIINIALHDKSNQFCIYTTLYFHFSQFWKNKCVFYNAVL